MKISKPWASESFYIGEHTEVLGGWHAWRGHGSSMLAIPLPPVPHPMHLFHLAVPECIFYNELIILSKAFSWILGVILVNYPTWAGKGYGNPQMCCQPGKSVCTAWYLKLGVGNSLVALVCHLWCVCYLQVVGIQLNGWTWSGWILVLSPAIFLTLDKFLKPGLTSSFMK